MLEQLTRVLKKMENSKNKLMDEEGSQVKLHALPRLCGAKTRKGTPCKKAPSKGKRRCRMHGGAPGSGAQKGNKNALKHGFYTAEAIAERKDVNELLSSFNADKFFQNLLKNS